MNLMITYAII